MIVADELTSGRLPTIRSHHADSYLIKCFLIHITIIASIPLLWIWSQTQHCMVFASCGLYSQFIRFICFYRIPLSSVFFSHKGTVMPTNGICLQLVVDRANCWTNSCVSIIWNAFAPPLTSVKRNKPVLPSTIPWYIFAHTLHTLPTTGEE